MDDRRFDELTRALGRVRSRRTVVKGLGATLVGGVLASRVRGGAEAQQFGICHATGSQNNPYEFITPDNQSYAAHLEHIGPAGGDYFATQAEAQNRTCVGPATTTTTTTAAPTTTTTTTAAPGRTTTTTTTARGTTAAPTLPSTGVGAGDGSGPSAGPALAALGAAAVIGRSLLRRIQGADSTSE